MKKTLMTMVALLTMTAAMAQDNDTKQRVAPQQPSAEQMVEFMARDLELTDEQKTKLVELNKEYDQKLKTILSEEQYKKYEADQQQRMQRMQQRQQGGGGFGGFGGGGFGGQQ